MTPTLTLTDVSGSTLTEAVCLSFRLEKERYTPFTTLTARFLTSRSDFGNLLHLGNNSLVHGAFFQFDSYISTSPVAQRLRVYMVAGADNNAQINQALYALVNGGT